ncbi:MAG: TIGR01212 family radical SAM protein [Planctomycetes bacterium]|nr:TIGR01212 family radical SAM protein [Planctomycetota bacterium]
MATAPARLARGWYSFSEYVSERFGPGTKVYKVTLDAGLTCPNIDGTVGRGGCTYCSNRSFSPPVREPGRSLAEQVRDGIRFYRERYGAEKFIAYFQAHTNTHAPAARLRGVYDEALSAGDFLGLDIGTRPDSVPDDVLDLIEEYARRYEVWVEYGLQSAHDRTLAATNRGHGFAEFEDAVRRSRNRGFRICAHLIHGLPGETQGMMLESARAVAGMGLDGIKIHHAYVARGTALAADWRAGRYRPIEMSEYLEVLVATLEVLPEDVVIHRLVGEFPGAEVLAPDWGIGKGAFLARVERELARRGTRQGARAAALASIAS